MFLWRYIKFNIKLFFLLMFVAIITFVLVTSDEIKENGLFLKNNTNVTAEIVKYDEKESIKVYNDLKKFDVYKEEITELEQDILKELDYVDDNYKRKFMDLYLSNLEIVKGLEKVYLDTYELDLMEYLKENNLSIENVKSISNKDYLMDFLMRLDDENLLIVKENYVERFNLEINYKALMGKYKDKVPGYYIDKWEKDRKSSLQNTLRSRKLYE